MVPKLKNSKYKKNKKYIYIYFKRKPKNWFCDKTQIVRKLKLSQNLNCDKKYILLQTSEPQLVAKIKKTQIVKQLKNSNSNKTQKLYLCQISKSQNGKTDQIATKLKN